MTTADATPVSARRALTRDRLLAAASAVFAERGILAASVEEICEQAGFTRGAFYSNFESKDDLYFALLRREHDRHFAATRNAIEEAGLPLAEQPSPEQLESLVHRAVLSTLRAMRSDREAVLTGYEMRLYAVRNREVTAKYQEFMRESYALMADLVQEALTASGTKLALDIDQVLGMLIAVIEQNQLSLLVEENSTDIESQVAGQLALLLRALAVD
ncbi:MAG: TetR/AcrR family transcriptional regulator [Propionibacteriaceae bacterium]